MRYITKAALAVAVAVLLAACGGGSPSTKTLTKSQWESKYATAVSTVSTQLDFARADLKKGVQQDILSGCQLLSDDVATAKGGLPVPNSAADAALRKALTDVTQGAADCIRGARIASQASITEQAMRELDTSRADLDTANRAIAAWT